MWDLFISHASEDKDNVVRPLALKLGGRDYTCGSTNRRYALVTL